MSDAPTTSSSTGYPPSGATSPFDELPHFQLVMSYFFGHPRLREVAEVLHQDGDHDIAQVLAAHGIDVPEGAKVGQSGAESDSPTEYHICVGSTYAHCVYFTLPDIHIVHHTADG